MTRKESMAYNMFRARVASAVSSLQYYAEDYDCKGLNPIIRSLEEALKDVRKSIK